MARKISPRRPPRSRRAGSSSAALLWLWPVLLPLTGCHTTPSQPDPASPEAKAVAYLVREVPAWSRENGCFSCHNNGDAARALFAAAQFGFTVPKAALADTLDWLSKPEMWEHNKGDPGFSDRRLARVQFTVALSEAIDHGYLNAPLSLQNAVALLLEDRDTNGLWTIGPRATVGAPATYGTVLATVLSLSVLPSSGQLPTATIRAKIEPWLEGLQPLNTVDTAALVLHFNRRSDTAAVALRNRHLAWLRQSQTSEGGWGPFPQTPAETFDTALVLLALVGSPEIGPQLDLVQQGRAFLLREQSADGSWPETTRPSGGQSYAQRLSTSAWATLALLKSRNPKNNQPKLLSWLAPAAEIGRVAESRKP